MGKIRILDDHIANQIAAGEVVERPASVVKELIENSIDAGSKKIEIRLEESGLSLIQIRDNGEGLEESDAETAFQRHATSKLKKGNDLFRIRTLGFRGEALPSIAAVSRLTLKTSDNQNGKGIEIQYEGGSLVSKQDIAYNRGTEIIVKDLFFNTPARLKYMKSLQTELGHITDYVNRLSLAYPSISFTLIHNDRLLLRTSGNNELAQVVGAIYGIGLAKNMVTFADDNLDFKISGLLSKPEITRANKTHISIFVNGRYIKNYVLSQAIVDGYKTLLMVNRYPIAILNIELEPSLIDVNVHPSKLEIRFSKEHELLKFVETTVYQALHKESFIREPLKKPVEKVIDHNSFQESFNYIFSRPKNETDYSEAVTDSVSVEGSVTVAESSYSEVLPSQLKSNLEKHAITDEQAPVTTSIEKKDRLPYLEPISQFMGTYILAQNETGLYLIDQHAAHERINYEKNIQHLNEETHSSQELIVPFTIELTKAEIDQLFQKKEILNKYGIDFDRFGQQTIIVRSISGWIPKGRETMFLDRIIQMILQKGEIQLAELRQDMIASISCKASIKANQFLSKENMEQLLDQLRSTENPFSCPHGRPVIIHFSTYEIEKMFKRVI